MAQYRGYQCDQCGKVVDKDDITEVTVRIDGPTVSGEFDQDLCLECAPKRVPEGANMRPLRRRHPRQRAEALTS